MYEDDDDEGGLLLENEARWEYGECAAGVVVSDAIALLGLPPGAPATGVLGMLDLELHGSGG